MAITTPPRAAEIERSTRETTIRLRLALDGAGECSASTGVGFLDHMLDLLARHARLDLDVEATGDLETGTHHTTEDIGIVLGQALDRALGDRSGIARYGDATVPMDEALATCAIDVSGRPYCAFEGAIPEATIGGWETELTEEFFRAVANNARLTVHVRLLAGTNAHHMIEASFKSFARALRAATSLDDSVTGIPSDQGRCCERAAHRDHRLRDGQSALGREGARALRRAAAHHQRPRGHPCLGRRRAARRRSVPEGDEEHPRAGARRADRRAAGGRHADARHLPRHAAAVRDHDGERGRLGPRIAVGPGRATARARPQGPAHRLERREVGAAHRAGRGPPGRVPVLLRALLRARRRVAGGRARHAPATASRSSARSSGSPSTACSSTRRSRASTACSC